MQANRVGYKIKQFRKSAGLTQLELELITKSSPGSISRIESGKTNPTKETVLLIASSLNLQPSEVGYLLGINTIDPSEVEIERAKLYTESMLKAQHSYSYLLDNKSRVLAISNGFQSFLNNLSVNCNFLINRNIVEILFDPSYGIRSIIDPNVFKKVSHSAMAILTQERVHLLRERWWVELLDRLNLLPGFTEAWEYVSRNNIDVLSEESRTVSFRMNGGRATFDMIYIPIYLYPDPRFSIVEYKPKGPNSRITPNQKLIDLP